MNTHPKHPETQADNQEQLDIDFILGGLNYKMHNLCFTSDPFTYNAHDYIAVFDVHKMFLGYLIYNEVNNAWEIAGNNKWHAMNEAVTIANS